tara:strand:- start:82776 stop:82922 length:147 start_codon:yes stop_codon:yes gene_type:complete
MGGGGLSSSGKIQLVTGSNQRSATGWQSCIANANLMPQFRKASTCWIL